MTISDSRSTDGGGPESARPGPGTSLRLTPPTEEVHASYLAALEEYCDEGGYPDAENLDVADPAAFARYVDALRRGGYRPDRWPEAEWDVPMTLLWLVDGNEYLGQISIRHHLTPALEESGGHIGYDIRRSARGRGYATRMLAMALPVATALGVNPALMICGETNVASRMVIERNGGKLWDQRDRRLYFWLPTGDAPAEPGS